MKIRFLRWTDDADSPLASRRMDVRGPLKSLRMILTVAGFALLGSLAAAGAAGAGEPEKVMAGGRFTAQAGNWNTIEVSNYQGSVQVWVDGQKEAEFQDPVPLPPGTISIEGHINADPNMAYYFDNMSVCELSAPFATSMYKPPAQ